VSETHTTLPPDKGQIHRPRVRFWTALAVWSGAISIFAGINPLAWPISTLLSVSAIAGGLGAAVLAEVMLVSGLTASMRAERESAERLHDFTDAASDWLWEMDEDLRFTYASNRFYELSGLSPEDFIGRRQDLAAKAKPQNTEWRNHLTDLQHHRAFRDFTYRERSPDDTAHWFRLSGTPKFAPDGAFTGYRGTGTNITAEVRAREEAIESTLRFLDAMEHVTDGIAFWDAEDHFVLCNQRYRDQAGKAASLLVRGTSYEDFIRGILKMLERPPAVDDHDGWVKRRIAEHRTPGNAIEVHRDNRWFLIRDDRSPDGSIVSVVNDITEVKQREQELQDVVDSVPLLLAYVDQDGRYQLINRTFENWLEISPDQVRGQTVNEMHQRYIHNDHIDKVMAALDGHAQRFEASIPYLGGTLLPGYRGPRMLEVTYTPNIDSNDKVAGFFVAAGDITERKLAAEQLHQAQKMEAIGQLTGGVAHDFNNLLAIMLGSLNLLEDRITGEREEKLVGAALRAARRGGELTQRLLAFGRRQALVSEITEANRLIGDLAELLQRTLGVSIQIETSFSEDLWLIDVDRGQLENALINLAINARDAMPVGGKLRVETSNVVLDQLYTRQFEDLTPGNYVMVAVNDTGTGMTPDILEHAIDPFFSTKETGQGSGLGLSMAYGFTKQSGGQMRIYSEPGHGTAVRLYLPAAKPGNALISKPSYIANGDLQGANECILVIEDDIGVRAVTVGMLTKLGYRVIEAGTGQEAIDIYRDASCDNNEFDLIFSDVFLPGGITGPQAVHEIKQLSPNIPVLFTSGYSADQVSESDLLDDDVQMIAKPFELADLARKLRECLEHPASE
jgi:PAS domain S-box-containing protein